MPWAACPPLFRSSGQAATGTHPFKWNVALRFLMLMLRSVVGLSLLRRSGESFRRYGRPPRDVTPRILLDADDLISEPINAADDRFGRLFHASGDEGHDSQE